MKFWIAGILGVVVGLLPFVSLAWADAIDLTLKSKVLESQKEKPHLVLKVNERLEALSLTLTREDGLRFTKKYKRVEEGGETHIDLPVVRGKKHHFKADFDLNLEGEELHREVEFDAELIVQPDFKIRNEDVNLDGGFLSLTSTRDVSRVDVRVTDDRGAVVAEKSQRYGVVPAGGKVELLWGPTEGRIFKIDLTIYDTDAFHYGVALFPWRYDIPHDEVNFSTGSADIAKSERPKLDASVKALKEVLRKMGNRAQLKLFIAGATDTVGEAQANLQLSAARAKSIARYFRKQGIQIPIFFTGLGENGLKVATADEVDESQNRRADYIVSIEEPVFSGDVPSITWISVK